MPGTSSPCWPVPTMTDPWSRERRGRQGGEPGVAAGRGHGHRRPRLVGRPCPARGLPQRLRRPGRHRRRTSQVVDITPFLDAGELLYEGPWVAERYAVLGDFLEAHPESLHPVTSAVLGRGKDDHRRPGLRGHASPAGARRRGGIDLATGRRAAAPHRRPDLHPGAGGGRRRGDEPGARPVHALREPAGPRGRGGSERHPRPDGRPASVSLLGPAFSDATLARLAAALTSSGPSAECRSLGPDRRAGRTRRGDPRRRRTPPEWRAAQPRAAGLGRAAGRAPPGRRRTTGSTACPDRTVRARCSCPDWSARPVPATPSRSSSGSCPRERDRRRSSRVCGHPWDSARSSSRTGAGPSDSSASSTRPPTPWTSPSSADGAPSRRSRDSRLTTSTDRNQPA